MSASHIDGRFVVERRAGEGGMGAVYRALDVSSGKPVALKVLHTAHRDQQAGRFEREAQLLAELSHPGIVRYVAHGMTERGALYLAMEWLEGEDLGARLRREGLTADETVRLAERASDALGFAHARGVVHRDIKPSNLFLVHGELDALRIIDFGIASAAGVAALTRTGTGVGTPGYMSPEQVKGARDVTAAADVFALGSVLYECLTARAAFVGDNVLAVLAQLLYEDVPRVRTIVPDVAPALEDLVHAMLDKSPSMRPADGHAVLAALRALAFGTPELGPRTRTTLMRARPRPRWVAEVTCPACYWSGPQEFPAGAHGRIPVTCGKCSHEWALDATLGDAVDAELDLALHDEPMHERRSLDVPMHERRSLDVPMHETRSLDVPMHETPSLDAPMHETPSRGEPVAASFSRAEPAARKTPAGAPRDPHEELDLGAGGSELELDLPSGRPIVEKRERDGAIVADDVAREGATAPARPASRAMATALDRERHARRDRPDREPPRRATQDAPASLGRRAAAAIIDAMIVYGVQGALWKWWLDGARARLVASGASAAELQQLGWIALGLALALAFVSATYFVVPTAVWGQTLGKKLLAIRVVDEHGEALEPGRAALREVVGRWLSLLGCGAGFALAWLGDERRTLHDRIARTRVVDAD